MTCWRVADLSPHANPSSTSHSFFSVIGGRGLGPGVFTARYVVVRSACPQAPYTWSASVLCIGHPLYEGRGPGVVVAARGQAPTWREIGPLRATIAGSLARLSCLIGALLFWKGPVFVPLGEDAHGYIESFFGPDQRPEACWSFRALRLRSCWGASWCVYGSVSGN